MYRVLRLGFIVFCIGILLFPPVAGYKVTSVSIDPAGALVPGTPVTVVTRIDFPDNHGETFSEGSALELASDLDNPTWNWSLTIDGVETFRPDARGRKLELSGFELSYKKDIQESLAVTLRGNAPFVERTTNKTIIRIQEIVCHDSHCFQPGVVYSALVVNTTEIVQNIKSVRLKLQGFRSNLDEKAAMGVNTTEAEVKYADAKSQIDTATCACISGHEEPLRRLIVAERLITEGERLLDKAWAEKEVLDAQVPITNADAIIAWFKGNRSTADLPELIPIISKRGAAVNFISYANDEIAAGNYSQARMKAKEAFQKGNDSYSHALSVQDKRIHHPDWLCQGCFDGRVLFVLVPPVICIIAIVLLIAGIFWWKKRKSGDTP
jgi:hypothetical protein